MSHTDSNRSPERKYRDNARKALRREKYRPVVFDIDALTRQIGVNR